MTKLQRLDDLTHQFKDSRQVECYFLGALSMDVSDEHWDKALQVALECAEKYKVPREQEAS